MELKFLGEDRSLIGQVAVKDPKEVDRIVGALDMIAEYDHIPFMRLDGGVPFQIELYDGDTEELLVIWRQSRRDKKWIKFPVAEPNLGQ